MKTKKEVVHLREYTTFDKTLYNHACGKGGFAEDEESCCSTKKTKVNCPGCLKKLEKVSAKKAPVKKVIRGKSKA